MSDELHDQQQTSEAKVYHYCPHCKEEMEAYTFQLLTNTTYHGTADLDGEWDFDDLEEDGADGNDWYQYFCPECGEQLNLCEVIKTDIKPENFLRDYKFTKKTF